MLVPSQDKLLALADIPERIKRSDMFLIDVEAFSQPSADVGGGSGNQILHGEHSQWSGLLVHEAGARQSSSERSEQIHTNSALPVD